MLVALVGGGSVLLQRRFAPEALLSCIERERATFWLGELAQWVRCAPLLERYDLSSLEIVGYAGASLPPELLERMKSLAPRIFTGYGMTETSNAIMFTDPDTPPTDPSSNNVGRPIQGVFTRLVSSGGEPVGAGVGGLLEVRSDLVFLGYLNRPEATAEAFTPDGWFRTGDLFRACPDGTFDFLGRVDDMYKSGGYNIYPREIEAVLESHARVGRVVVVGVPDEVYQAVGHAFVELLPGDDRPATNELRDYCSERLANYKVPKAITVLEELPRLRNEKVDKVSLRQMALGARSGGD
jgi:acyl-CoA synthetase (AMP-forming)/AMP-acid ligase II